MAEGIFSRSKGLRIVAAIALCIALAWIGFGGFPSVDNGSQDGVSQLHVAVASNFAACLKVIAEQFTAESGTDIVLSAGSTGKHFTQIENGAPFDVFFAADSERPERLETDGFGIAGTRFTYAIGRLAIWAPGIENDHAMSGAIDPLKPGSSMSAGSTSRASITDSRPPDITPETLRSLMESGEFRFLAIANPRLAPYGRAAVQVLTELGLWRDTDPAHPLAIGGLNVVQGENIGQTHAFLASGNADIGFVALSQVQQPGASPSGFIALVPERLHAPIEQQALLLSDSSDGRAFLDFVRGTEAKAIMVQYGYGVRP